MTFHGITGIRILRLASVPPLPREAGVGAAWFFDVTEASGVLVIEGSDVDGDQNSRTRMLGHRSRTTGSGSLVRESCERAASFEGPGQWISAGGVVVYVPSSRRQSWKTNPPSTRRIVPVM